MNVILTSLWVILIQYTRSDQFIQRIQSQIRIDCAGTEAQQRCKMMYFTWLSCFHNDGNRSVLSGLNQILLQSRNCQQRRNCHMFLIDTPVGQNQNGGTILVCLICLHIQMFNGILQRCFLIIQHWQSRNLHALYLHATNFNQIQVGQNRILYL